MDGDGARWVQVVLPWATFGLAVKAGRVVDAAPVARWAIGRDERAVAAYYRRKGAAFRPLPGEGGHTGSRARAGPA